MAATLNLRIGKGYLAKEDLEKLLDDIKEWRKEMDIMGSKVGMDGNDSILSKIKAKGTNSATKKSIKDGHWNVGYGKDERSLLEDAIFKQAKNAAGLRRIQGGYLRG